MPYNRIVFLKLFVENTVGIVGLKNDDRFTDKCDDDMKSIYLFALMTAISTENKIPSDGKYIKRVWNLEMSAEDIENNLKKLEKVWRKFVFFKGYYHFTNFKKIHNLFMSRRINSVDKQGKLSEFQRSAKGVPKEFQRSAQIKNKEEEKEEEKEKERDRSHPLLQLQDYYFEKLKLKIENPVFSYKIAAGCFNGLLKTQSLEEIKNTIDNFFETKDKFFINSGYDVKKFASSYNAFKAKAMIPPKPTMEQMRKENPGVIKSHLEIILQDEIKKWEKEWGGKK